MKKLKNLVKIAPNTSQKYNLVSIQLILVSIKALDPNTEQKIIDKLYEASIAEWSKNENLPMEQRFEILDQKSYLNGDDGFSMKPSN